MDSSKRRKDAKNLTLHNNVETFIKIRKIFGIVPTFGGDAFSWKRLHLYGLGHAIDLD